jgi:hypothetical protein
MVLHENWITQMSLILRVFYIEVTRYIVHGVVTVVLHKQLDDTLVDSRLTTVI